MVDGELDEAVSVFFLKWNTTLCKII
jgi:hypothetical protein